MAADPFSGAVAQVLLDEIAEPGWKPNGKQLLSSSKVEVFAQYCSHVCILTLQLTCSPAGSPAALQTEPAGGPSRLILARTPLSSSSGQNRQIKGSLYFCTTGELKDKVDWWEMEALDGSLICALVLLGSDVADELLVGHWALGRCDRVSSCFMKRPLSSVLLLCDPVTPAVFLKFVLCFTVIAQHCSESAITVWAS